MWLWWCIYVFVVLIWNVIDLYKNIPSNNTVKGTITVDNKTAQGQPNNGANKKVIFKNYASFTKCISRINNTQINDTHDIDVVMPTYNVIDYSHTYSKTYKHTFR